MNNRPVCRPEVCRPKKEGSWGEIYLYILSNEWGKTAPDTNEEKGEEKAQEVDE